MKCGTPLSYCKAELPEGYPFKRCEPCRMYMRVMTKRRRNRQIKAGLCSYLSCSRRPAPGRSMCKTHLKRSLEIWNRKKRVRNKTRVP